MRGMILLTIAVAILGMTAGIQAADLTWDTVSGDGTVTDGGGTWLDPDMWTADGGATNTTWNSVTPDNAIIGSGGNVNNLTINLAGDPNAGTVLFDNFSGNLRVDSGILDVSTSITMGPAAGSLEWRGGSGLSGTGDIIVNGPYPTVKNGPGMFNIRQIAQANLTISGDVIINRGVVLVHSSTPSGNITLNAGTGATDGAVYESYWGYTLGRNLGTAAGEVQVLGGRAGFCGQGTTGMTVRLTDPNIGSQTVQWGSAYFNPSELILQSHNANTNGNVNFDTSIDLNGADRTISVDKEHGYHWDTAGNIDNRGRGTISRPIFNADGNTPAGLIKQGAGRLALNAANTYDGGTTVNEGILHYHRADAMPSTGTTTFNDGAELWVDLKGGDDFTPAASGAGSLGGLLSGTGTGGSAVVYNGDVDLTLLAGGSPNYVGDIADLGGAGTTTNVWIWDGGMTLSGTGTYSGTTVIGARGRSAITVTLGSATALPVGGPVTIDSSGTSRLDLNGFNATIGLLKMGSNNGGQGGTVQDTVGGAVLTLTNGIYVDGHNDGGGFVICDTIDLNGTTQTFEINNNRDNTDLEISSAIENGGLILRGGGSRSEFIFTGELLYAGGTTIEAGRLKYDNIGDGLDDASTLDIFAGARVDLNFVGTDTIGALILDGVDVGTGTFDSTHTTYGSYFLGTGSLLVSAGPIADTNGDGVVDAADYINLKRNLGTLSGATLADGDIDGDGDVDWDDLTAMGAEMNAAAGANTIPEPATMGLLAFGALALIRRRRK